MHQNIKHVILIHVSWIKIGIIKEKISWKFTILWQPLSKSWHHKLNKEHISSCRHVALEFTQNFFKYRTIWYIQGPGHISIYIYKKLYIVEDILFGLSSFLEGKKHNLLYTTSCTQQTCTQPLYMTSEEEHRTLFYDST